MRQPFIKPDSTPVFLHNYLPHKFTFYWDKEAYTLEAGEKVKMFKWLAVHGAMKIAEEYFNVNPTNPHSTDPKVRGFYSRHEDFFKAKVKEAIIESESPVKERSETARSVDSMNDVEEKEEKERGVIELPEVEDEILPGCQECKATGPRHKPTCSKFVKHAKDEAQAAKLREATAGK
jgi:hypothetical protein